MTTPATPANTTTTWATGLLKKLGDAVTPNNIGNLKLWLAQEQNARTWAADQNNPLGVRNGLDGNVHPYPTFDLGIQGTAATLNNGLYATILRDLRGNAPTTQFATDVVNSPWSGLTYRQRGVSEFLAGGPGAAGQLNAAAKPVTSTGAALTGFNWNPLTWPGQILGGVAGGVGSAVGGAASGVASATFNAAKPFIAKVTFALLGLGLIGFGIYKIADPKGPPTPDLSTIAKVAAE